MKPLKTIFLLSAISLIITNCRSSVKIPRDKKVNLNIENLSNLNGAFWNYSNYLIDTTYYKTSFWEHINHFNSILEQVHLIDSTSYFKLEILDKKRIKFDLFTSKNHLSSTTLKYRFLDGGIVISCSKNGKLDGVPLIFYRHRCEALRIGLDKEKNLVMTFNGTVSGGILILIFGGDLNGFRTFDRVE